MKRENITSHANDYDRKKNRNGGAVSKFMLILKTCKLFAILFDNEYISLCIKYWNKRADFEKCVFITDTNMYIQYNSENLMC